MRRIPAAAVLIAALTTTAACGSKDRPAVAPASPAPVTSTAAPRAQDDYDGAQRLVGALNEAGIKCVNWERTDNPLDAEELGSCYVGTEQVVTAIYGDHDGAAGEPESKAGLLAGVADVNVVVGGNWTLSCDSEDLCARIADQFGGTMNHISK